MKYGIASSWSLEIEFTLKPGKRREFARSFEDLICPASEGHVKSSVFEDLEEPGHMIWIASWSSRESLEAYIRGSHFGIVIGALKVLSSCPGGRLIEEAGARAASGSSFSHRIVGESRSTTIDLGPDEQSKQ